MTPQGVEKVAANLLDVFNNWGLFGWVFCFVITFAWYLHSKSQRRGYAQEFRRMGDAKTKSQESALNKNLGSSDAS